MGSRAMAASTLRTLVSARGLAVCDQSVLIGRIAVVVPGEAGGGKVATGGALVGRTEGEAQEIGVGQPDGPRAMPCVRGRRATPIACAASQPIGVIELQRVAVADRNAERSARPMGGMGGETLNECGFGRDDG